jgi:hypothetical protein
MNRWTGPGLPPGNDGGRAEAGATGRADRTVAPSTRCTGLGVHRAFIARPARPLVCNACSTVRKQVERLPVMKTIVAKEVLG